MHIKFGISESSNFTIYIDTDTEVTDGVVFSNSTKSQNHSYIFDFGFNAEITHYMNITTCDTAGNCNTTAQSNFPTPARICGGWSQYGIYDSIINLSKIQNQSGADLVYFWNATNQNWVFFTAGLSTNGGVDVGIGTHYPVVHLFENTNSTWYRNTTKPLDFYHYNVSSVSNFVSILTDYDFGNLSWSFGNTSKNFPSFINESATNAIKFGPFNITSFAGYNNSKQGYVNHIFNFTWANATLLEPCPLRTDTGTCMETFLVASDFNVTWNGTAILRNWTIAK